MPNDNSTVQITVKVVDANSGKTIQDVTDNLNSLGDAGAGSGKKVAEGLGQIGEAGTTAGQKVAAGMQGVNTAMRLGVMGARQLGQEVGVNLPRSMSALTSSTASATEALGGFIGIIGVIAAVGLYNLYKRFIDVGHQVDDFNHKLSETARQRFFDVASIEDVNANLIQTNALLDQLDKKRQSSMGVGGLIGATIGSILNGGGLSGGINAYALQVYNPMDVKERNQAQQQNDNDRIRKLDDEHRAKLKDIEVEKERATAIRGTAAAQAEFNARQKEAEESRRFTNARAQLEADIVNRGRKPGEARISVAPDAGVSEEQMQVAVARAGMNAKNEALEQSGIRETARMRAEAGIAAQRGEAAYAAQRLEQERLVKQKVTDTLLSQSEGQKQLDAIDAKYAADRMKRLEAEHAETARLQAEANTGGLHGLAKIGAATDARIAGIDKAAPGFSDPATQAQREAAIRRQGDADAEQAQREFYDRIAQLDSSRTDRYASENQRIQAAADHTVTEITRAWREMYGQLDAMDQRRVQSQQSLNAEILKIQQDAARQKAEASERLEQQTEKMEAEGARAGLNRDQERTQQIVDEYNERYRQLEELRMKDAANADQYRRQELAAEEIKNGKLIEQQRQMRDRLAGQLRGFFRSPLDELRRQGEDAGAKIAASLIVHMRDGSPLNGGYGDPGVGGMHGGVLGGLLGSRSARSGITSSSSTLSATTAIIHVGTATITGGGFGGVSAGAGAPSIISDIGSGISGIGSIGSSGSTMGAASEPGSTASNVSSTLSSLPGMTKSVADLNKEIGAVKLPHVTELAGKDSGIGKLLGSSKAAGLAGGGLSLFSAFQGNGGFGGALSGALGGAKVGAEFGGPIGAAIGAIGGAVMGFMGFGGRGKAEDYDHKQVQPRISNDLLAYEAGSMDYQTAYDDFDSLSREAKMTTRQWGSGGTGYYNDHIKGEIIDAQARLTREQIAGRSEFGMTAAQLHSGGVIDGFGSMATSSDEGWIHAKKKEVVMHEQAAATHGVELRAMLAGASRADMATYYGGTKRAVATSSAPVNLNFRSHDAKGAYQLFMDNKHHIRAALNQSYAENSGGADFA
jgi:hypothetical protein